MILVFGKVGQVAQALQADLREFQVEYFDRDLVDFLNPEKVIALLEEKKPRLVINASAYTQVDKAETEKDLAMQINAHTPTQIAQWCASHKVPMIHFSTDYVFNGQGEAPWLENMPTDPVNYYGLTKLTGDLGIQNSGCRHFIFRISWVYAPWGHNFPKTILRLAQEREELKIVSDQVGSPTDAREVSYFIKLLLNKDGTDLNLESGVYHLSFKKVMTWFDLANLTIAEARQKNIPLKVKQVLPIPSSAFPTPAKRPLNSRMDTLHPEIKPYIEKVQQVAKEKKWGYLEG